MKYTKKHKNLIANLFKKTGMLEEANTVLSYDDYKDEIANAIRNAAKKAEIPIEAKPALLDVARRYENRNCAIFKEYTLPHCKGGVCALFIILAEAMAKFEISIAIIGRSAFDVSFSERCKLSLQMLDYKTRQTHHKSVKGLI